MRFYNKSHTYYCGIDLHTRNLYVCILDQQGEKRLHKNIKACPIELKQLLKPFMDNLVLGVECMHCWYWVADWCADNHTDFVLGHALYMKAIHGGKAKNDKIDSFKIAKLLRGGNFPVAYHYPKAMRTTRDLLRQRTRLVRYSAELKSVEGIIKQHDRQHNERDFTLLKTISGVGDILALTILYEIGNIDRFVSVQKFASYSRLVKCKAESAGKSYGTAFDESRFING